MSFHTILEFLATPEAAEHTAYFAFAIVFLLVMWRAYAGAEASSAAVRGLAAAEEAAASDPTRVGA